MAYTAQPTAPGSGNVLTDAFIQTMLDNIAYLKSEADALRLLTLVQRFRTAEFDDTITSTSFVDTSFTQSITTGGGRLRIYLIPSVDDGDFSYVGVNGPGTGILEGHIRAVVGATNLAAISQSSDDLAGDDMTRIHLGPGAFVWEYTPAAGTYTVKLQAFKNASATTTNIELVKLRMVVEEWGT